MTLADHEANILDTLVAQHLLGQIVLVETSAMPYQDSDGWYVEEWGRDRPVIFQEYMSEGREHAVDTSAGVCWCVAELNEETSKYQDDPPSLALGHNPLHLAVVPEYSRNVVWAWDLVERVRPCCLSIDREGVLDPPRYEVRAVLGYDNVHLAEVKVVADNLPEAICKALLAAKGVTV